MVLQISIPCGQRGWNRQPAGTCAASGVSPLRIVRVARAPEVGGSGDGETDTNASVYGLRGVRITASAGTDVFLNRIRSFLPGDERVYVKVEGPLTYEKWIAGLRAGRSFVSNGPILELSVDGKEIGDTVASVEAPEALPRLIVDEPVLRMSFGVNTSPVAGRVGKYVTSRHLRERLQREILGWA